MLRMYVTDVDKYPTDRFPIFAKAVANHINRTFANMQKTDFFASSKLAQRSTTTKSSPTTRGRARLHTTVNPAEMCPF